MFIDYIIVLWECGKAHILHIGSLDDLPSEVEISDKQVITIGGERLYINYNLSDSDYGDFFEVGYNKGGGPCTIIFKKGKTKSVKVKTGFESVGKKGGYYLIKTKVIACMGPSNNSRNKKNYSGRIKKVIYSSFSKKSNITVREICSRDEYFILASA